MTADVELLPLPEKSEIDRHLPTGVRVYGYTASDMKTYARACVAHATTAQAAEIEALREAYGQVAADKFAATFRCERNGIVGSTNAPIHSVSMHDDGVIEVVIDHWPEQSAAVDETTRRDAERYRWLRIKCGLVPSAFGIGQVAMTLAGSTDEHDAKRLDAHIDAAMNGANA